MATTYSFGGGFAALALIVLCLVLMITMPPAEKPKPAPIMLAVNYQHSGFPVREPQQVWLLVRKTHEAKIMAYPMKRTQLENEFKCNVEMKAETEYTTTVFFPKKNLGSEPFEIDLRKLVLVRFPKWPI